MHIAQLNIGRFRQPIDHEEMAEFRDNLDRVNAIADRSPGFVWRLTGEGNNATDIRFDVDPLMALNMSVWETPKALEDYVFRTVHAQFYRKRADWFEKMDRPHMVFWWVEEGHIPSIEEALERLAHFTAHGATDHAFGWPEVIDSNRLRVQRCAAGAS